MPSTRLTCLIHLQDYYDAQFSMGEAGPPAYVVFTDLDYFQAFNDTDVQQAFHGVATGLAQLQRRVLGGYGCCCRANVDPSFGVVPFAFVFEIDSIRVVAVVGGCSVTTAALRCMCSLKLWDGTACFGALEDGSNKQK